MSKKDRCIRKAEGYVLASRIEKGIEAYLEAYDSDPEDFHPLILAGDLHIKLNQNDQAVRILRRAASGYLKQGRLADTLRIYRKIGRLLPGEIGVLLTLIDLCFKTHARPDALRFITDAGKLLLDRPPASPDAPSQTLQLIQLVEQAVRSGPDPDLLTLQARLYEKVGRDEEAYALYWQAASILTQEGKLQRSLSILDHLLKTRATDLVLVEAATAAMTKLGRPLEALALQKQILQQDPNNVRLLKVMVKTLVALEHYDEAEQACCRLFTLDRHFYNEFLEFVYLLVSRQEHDRSVRCVKEMLPKSSYLQKAELAYVLKRVLEQIPHHIEALRTLAETYERYNDLTQALKVYPMLFDILYRSGKASEAYQVGQRMLELNYKEDSFLKNYDKIFLQIAGGPQAVPATEATATYPSSALVVDSSSEEKPADAAKMSWGHPSGPTEGEDSLIASVDLLVRYGYHDNAIQVLKSHIETEPPTPLLREKLKEVYLGAKLLSNAAKECAELYKLYLERGLRDKAQESLREALKLEPTLSLKSLEGGRESTTGFVGDFGLFTIVEVIQFIENSCKTGILKIVSPTEEGRLMFNGGQVVDACVGDKAGIQALYHLIRVESGSYEFEPRNGKFPEKIRINTMNLLLEGLRLLDEERARRTAAPAQR